MKAVGDFHTSWFWMFDYWVIFEATFLAAGHSASSVQALATDAQQPGPFSVSLWTVHFGTDSTQEGVVECINRSCTLMAVQQQDASLCSGTFLMFFVLCLAVSLCGLALYGRCRSGVLSW
ncbi:hypothetical protein Ancab_012236 [Ancistrocladus abbreviatus]